MAIDDDARCRPMFAGEDGAAESTTSIKERYGHVREVSLCVEDAEGGWPWWPRPWRAPGGGAARRKRPAKVRYEEFVKGRAERKERKARREGIINLCCSGVGAAAFLGFLVMLTA